MTFAPAIQSFVSDHTGSANSSACLVDWPSSKVFPYDVASPFSISRFAFSTGTEEAHGVLENLGLAQPLAVAPNGYIYSRTNAANYASINTNLASDFSFVGTWGTSSPTVGPPTAVPTPGVLTPVTSGTINYLAMVSGIPFGDEGHSISVLWAQGVPSFTGALFYLTAGAGNYWVQCPFGPAGHQGGTYTMESLSAYTKINLYRTAINRDAIVYDPTTWPMVNGAVTTVARGSLLPSAINPAYDQIRCTGVVYDQTDHSVIAQVLAGTGSPTTNYIIKVDQDTCALKWAVQCPAPEMSIMMGRGVVKGGSFAVFFANAFSKQLTVIDTVTGDATITTAGFGDILDAGEQCFNSDFGCILTYVDYSGGTAPVPLGNTPSAFSGWAAIYVTNKVIPPYVPGGRVAYTKIWGAPAAV